MNTKYFYVVDKYKLNALRIERTLTIRQLASKAGMPFSTLGKLCSGLTPHTKESTVEALAKALNVSIDAFATKSQKPQKTLNNHTKTLKNLNYDYRKMNEVRIAQDLSFADLADKSHLAKSTVINICMGRIATPHIDSMQAIADALNLSLDDIYLEQKDEPTSAESKQSDENKTFNTNKFCNLMREQGLTRIELAEKAGIHPSTVSKIITQARNNYCPSLDVLIRVAKALGVPYQELYINEDDIAIEKIRKLDTSTILKLADVFTTHKFSIENVNLLLDTLNLLSNEQIVECTKLLKECSNAKSYKIKLIINLAKAVSEKENISPQTEVQ